MSTSTSVTIALDTVAGVEQFLVYVEEVYYAALTYEVDARERAALDPNHTTGLEELSESLQSLYGVIRTEIAAAATRGGMTNSEAEKLQIAYDKLTKLRDELKAISVAKVRPQQRMSSGSATPNSSVIYSSGRRKTLTVAADDTDGIVSISRPNKPASIAQEKQATKLPSVPTHISRPPAQERFTASNSTRTTERTPPVATKKQQRPAIASTSTPPTPLLSYITDNALLAQLPTAPDRKQLEQRIRTLIDREEVRHIDRVSRWLGDTPTHTFSYLKDKDVSTAYGLAALPITELRATLAPHYIRPETYLAWMRFVSNLQQVYPGSPTSTIGEVVVSGLALQLLDYNG